MDTRCPRAARCAPSLLPALGIHSSAYRRRQERLPGEFQTARDNFAIDANTLTLFTASFLLKDWQFPAGKTGCDSGARPSLCARFPGGRLGGADAG